MACAAIVGWLFYSHVGGPLDLTQPLEPSASAAGQPQPTLARDPDPRPALSGAQAEPRSLTGRVTTESGRGIAGANVCIHGVADSCCAPDACSTSDHSGAFALTVPGARAALVLASADGYLPLRRIVSDTRPSAPLELVLRTGGARITGTVVDASGGPVTNALLTARDSSDSHTAIGVSDAAGKFSLTATPGTTLVAADADGYSRVQLYVDAPQDAVSLVLVAASSLSGRVLEEQTQSPIEGVDVIASSHNGIAGGLRTVSTDRDGRFHFDNLASGAYSVHAVH
jgi:hypothetical protein